jgi:hypothetical protein
MIPPTEPFKNREEVKKDIRIWFNISLVLICLGLLLALIGIIADTLDRTLGLATTSWFLLAIFFSVTAAGPLVKSTIYRHLYGIESELKSE